jgi:hypothetical protein
MTKSGPKLKDKPTSRAKGTSVPYGPPQPEPDVLPTVTHSAADTGKTALKVGAAIALPFLLRAVFKAVTK